MPFRVGGGYGYPPFAERASLSLWCTTYTGHVTRNSFRFVCCHALCSKWSNISPTLQRNLAKVKPHFGILRATYPQWFAVISSIEYHNWQGYPKYLWSYSINAKWLSGRWGVELNFRQAYVEWEWMTQGAALPSASLQDLTPLNSEHPRGKNLFTGIGEDIFGRLTSNKYSIIFLPVLLLRR